METREHEVKVTVNKLFKKNGLVTSEETEVETVELVRLNPEAPYVTVSTDRKYTKNLGNYQSCSFSVFLSVPCPMDEDQMEQAYQFVSDFCEKKLSEKLKEVEGS